MPKSQAFAALWSRSVKVITATVLMVLAGMTVGSWLMPAKTPASARWMLWLTPGLILMGTLPFVVRGYLVGEHELTIIRLGWRNRIPFADIVSAEADPSAMNGSLRVFGSGGLFGFFGWFWNRRLGRYRAYCTDLSHSVVVQLREGHIVLSPDDPAQFVAELQARLATRK